MKADLKVTDAFIQNNEECIQLHSFIKEKALKMNIKKPIVLISITSGIAYIFGKNKPLPSNNNAA